MTASITQSLTTANAQPFCDARYKAIRVLGQCIGRTLYASALLIVAVVCRIFSEHLASMYYSWADLQFRLGWYPCITYWLFGEKVINFARNGCIAVPPANTEEQALRNCYGPDTIDQWLRIGTDEIGIKGAELKRLDGSGICAGMSIDFCSQYFAQINMDVSPREAVRKISARYITGAPKAAQLAQIFYDALLWQNFTQRRDINSNDPILSAHHRAVISVVTKRIWTFVFNLECLEIIRNQFGLLTKSITLYSQLTSSLKECDINLVKCLATLSPGCYHVGIRSPRCSHAIVIIKVSNTEYYIFEPNYSTIMCNNTNDVAKEISKIAKSICGMNNLLFSFSSIASSQKDGDRENRYRERLDDLITICI